MLPALLSAAPERSACEIEAEVVEVAGTTVVMYLQRRGEALLPRMEMSALDGERTIASLSVETISSGRAIAAVVGEGGGRILAGMRVVAPCPLPITAVDERG
ncbi:MAG: hypothetical protein FJX74_18745, partial [Armatimonadetes bacterium]|nr:hypothetical protein [Armatimonadota bacterium]